MLLKKLNHLPTLSSMDLKGISDVKIHELASIKFCKYGKKIEITDPIDVCVIAVMNGYEDDSLLMYHRGDSLKQQVPMKEVEYVDVLWDLAEYQTRKI